MALREPSKNRDRTSSWLAERFVSSYYAKMTHHFRPGIHSYRENFLYTIMAVIATVLFSLLLVLNTVVLYVVHSTPAPLAIVAAFTAAFSFALAVFTIANLVENFAATPA